MLHGGAACGWKCQEAGPVIDLDGPAGPDELKVPSDYRVWGQMTGYGACNERLKVHCRLKTAFLLSKRWGTTNRYASVGWRLLAHVVHTAIHKKCG
jgi:hypothetical protein